MAIVVEPCRQCNSYLTLKKTSRNPLVFQCTRCNYSYHPVECTRCKTKIIKDMGVQPFSTVNKLECKSCHNAFLCNLNITAPSISSPTVAKTASVNKNVDKAREVKGENVKYQCPFCGSKARYVNPITTSNIECCNPRCKFYWKG
jgi:hypothetical protein